MFKACAEEYIANRNYTNITNIRVISIKYDFEKKEWVEDE
jgi:hypothetical protein